MPELPFTVECNSEWPDRFAHAVGIGLTALGLVIGGYLAVRRDKAVVPPVTFESLFVLFSGIVSVPGPFLWYSNRRSTWTFDPGGWTRDGPGDRRCDLRWADVEAVKFLREGVIFRTRAGRFYLTSMAVPRDRQGAVRAWLDRCLRASFAYPRPAMSWGEFWWWMFRLLLGGAYFFVFQYWLRHVVLDRPDEVVAWIRSHETLRRLIVRLRTASPILVDVVALSWFFSSSLLPMVALFAGEAKRAWMPRRDRCR